MVLRAAAPPARRDDQPETVAIPIVGRVAAGVPITASENLEDTFVLPASFVGRNGAFMLRVKGDSMIDAGILSGDIVAVRKTETAKNGDIVVALAGDDESADEATVKRYFREDGRIRLQPENEALEPIYAKHVQILGKVVGVFRAL
jgi:repressor LexA